MQIEIRDEDQTLIISNDELDNENFVDLEFLSDLKKDEDNPRGYVGECTVSIEELKVAADAFWEIKKNYDIKSNQLNNQ